MLRREFLLPEDDIQYLNAKVYEWETIRSNGTWLLINNFPLPNGYNVSEATVAINMAYYAPGPLDMVYVNPTLIRNDGKIINCVQHIETIDNKPFQRWSRHYQWDNEKCNLITHLIQIEEWFNREFSLR